MSHHAEPTFMAYVRSGPRGEDVALEAAYDPWENEIDEMDQRLGFKEPGAKPKETHDDDAVRIAAARWSEFLRYCFEGVWIEPDGRNFQLAIKRFVAVGYAMFPNLLRVPREGYVGNGHGPKPKKRKVGEPITLNELAKQARTTPKTMEKMAKEFMDRWESCVD
jgi:hypothetical protein